MNKYIEWMFIVTIAVLTYLVVMNFQPATPECPPPPVAQTHLVCWPKGECRLLDLSPEDAKSFRSLGMVVTKKEP
jgi:hypothetical protein